MDKSFQAAFESALDWWDAMGVEVPKVAPAKPKARPKNTSPKTQTGPAKTASHKTSVPSLSNAARITAAETLAKSAKDLDALKLAMASFDAGTLSDNAVQCVFARGNPDSRLMIIGEAPGRDEDIEGKPFVGRSGQLLDRMLAAIGLTEDEFYVTNVINWRPPGNRNPTPEEIELCRPFLHRHIELAAPDILLIVGGVSLSAMTDLTGIMKNRGTWQELKIAGREIPALPIYHPAFLLRRPELKKEAWRDLLSLHEKLSELG